MNMQFSVNLEFSPGLAPGRKASSTATSHTVDGRAVAQSNTGRKIANCVHSPELAR
jgi:hypothetical protein